MTAATSQGAVAISLAATNLEAVVINPAVAHIRDQAIHLRILLTLREHSPNHSLLKVQMVSLESWLAR